MSCGIVCNLIMYVGHARRFRWGCSRPTFTTSSMCAPAMLCIGPAEVATSKPPETTCVLLGHAQQGRVTADRKGKAAAATSASPELLVHVPGVSKNEHEQSVIKFVIVISKR
jgi:hypothetical protein